MSPTAGVADHDVQARSQAPPAEDVNLVVCVTADVEVDKSSTYAISNPVRFHGTTKAIP